MIKAISAFPLISCGYPTTALSTTFGCSFIEFSIGAVPRLWPETITTSSTLPVILYIPFSSLRAPSPGKYLFLYAEKYTFLYLS